MIRICRVLIEKKQTLYCSQYEMKWSNIMGRLDCKHKVAVSTPAPVKALSLTNTHLLFMPAIEKSVLVALSSRNFIVFKSLSVQVVSSTSTPFEVEGVEDDGRGKMKSLRTCSPIALHLGSIIRRDSEELQRERLSLDFWRYCCGPKYLIRNPRKLLDSSGVTAFTDEHNTIGQPVNNE